MILKEISLKMRHKILLEYDLEVKFLSFLSKTMHSFAIGTNINCYRAVVMVLKLGGQAIPSQIIGWAKHTLLPKICPIF